MKTFFDSQRTEERIRKLEKYFNETVLSSDEFICKHYDECRSSHSGLFYEGQLHHVGKFYDLFQNDVPLRIAVVGQEYGHEGTKVSIAKRGEAIMKTGLEAHFKSEGSHKGRNPHMRGTTSLLRLLFGKGLGTDYDSEFIHFSSAEACHIFNAFALTNFLLCSAVPKDGKSLGQSTNTMKRNCIGHFRRVMEILEPTVIVVQGKGFGWWVKYIFDSTEDMGNLISKVKLGSNTSLLAIFTHPSAHYPYNWGMNEKTPYLLETIKPTVQTIHDILFRRF